MLYWTTALAVMMTIAAALGFYDPESAGSGGAQLMFFVLAGLFVAAFAAALRPRAETRRRSRRR